MKAIAIDEDLVEDLTTMYLEFLGTSNPNKEDVKKSYDAIRKLLQSRPSVTRDEIYFLLQGLNDMYGINCINSVTFEIMEFLRSKGVKVEEK